MNQKRQRKWCCVLQDSHMSVSPEVTYPCCSLAPLGYRTLLLWLLPTYRLGWHPEEANMPPELLERTMAEDEDRRDHLPLMVQKETFS